jgi:hypothetical protein
MEQIIMLLQSAIMLLASLTSLGNTIPDDIRLQASDIANRAVLYAAQEMTRLEKLPINATTTMPESNQSTSSAPVEEIAPPAPGARASKAIIEIFSPIPTKGLGRTFKVVPDAENQDANQLHLGAVVRDALGKPVRTAEVVITASDETQNKTLKGTGNVTKVVLPNGRQEKVYYYPFDYELRTAGKHTITFSADGLTESVEVEVAAEKSE